jgi:peptidyl-prolyl cis-trans isomerase SurA
VKKIIIAAAVLSVIASVAWAKLVDKILVKVNDEVILQSEVDEAVDLLSTQMKMAGKAADKAELKKEIIKGMLEQKLIITMAKDENIVISEEAVADRTNEFVNTLRERFATEAEFEEALIKEGMSYTDFRMKIDAQVRDNMAFTKVKQKKQQEFISKAVVTDDELKEYYGKNKSGFKVNDETNVSQILIEKGKAGVQDIAKYVKDISARITTEGFEAVMKDLDGKAGIKTAELGWIDTAVLDRNIRAGLENIKKGAITKPVETEDAFHILKVVDVKRGKLQNFEDVREKVRVKIIEEKVEKLWNDWIGKVKKDAFIKYM